MTVATASATPDGRVSGPLASYVGLLGVLLGTMMSTLDTRVTVFGLADLRGALDTGFDEGAWITTVLGIGQLIGGICCPYLATVIGPRRMLLGAILVFFVATVLAPFSPNLRAYLVAQFLGGLGSETFIPLTIIFILRHMPKGLLVYGLAIYAMNSEFSQNIAASLEGFYTDNWSWRWIDGQYGLLLPAMFACVWFGMPRDEPYDSGKLRVLDWPAILYASLGFGLLFAGIDQGNRLDWTRSGLVCGLLLAGAVAAACFVIRELMVARPAIDLRILSRGYLILLFVLLAGFRFIILSTGYITPNYLQTIQNYRGLQIGSVLIWIALPQFLIVLPLATALTRIDPRWTLGVGTALIGVACLLATDLTDQWVTDDFVPSQAIQAVGQSLALTSLVVLIARATSTAEAVTIGTFMQTSRLFGGEVGIGFMQTFIRVREQIHSNLLGLHVQSQDDQSMSRLLDYSRVLGTHISDASEAAVQSVKLLANVVGRQAFVLACIDGFQAAAAVAAMCWILAAFVASGLSSAQKTGGPK